jgi:adenosylcobyric acid synthase
LGLLPVETVLQAPKTTTLTRFSWNGVAGAGYEIHMGRTRLLGGDSLFRITARNGSAMESQDGCVTADHRSMGTYMHGLFDTPEVTRRWLAAVGLTDVEVPETGGLAAKMEQYKRLAEHFRKHVDVEKIGKLVGIDGNS